MSHKHIFTKEEREIIISIAIKSGYDVDGDILVVSFNGTKIRVFVHALDQQVIEV